MSFDGVAFVVLRGDNVVLLTFVLVDFDVIFVVAAVVFAVVFAVVVVFFVVVVFLGSCVVINEGKMVEKSKGSRKLS